MSDDMSPWRSIASAASRHIKGYVANHDPRRVSPYNRTLRPDRHGVDSSRQSWGQWASQKLKNMTQNYDAAQPTGLEQLSLFPGWAARRYREAHNQQLEGSAFDIKVFVSGFSSRSSGTGFTTRGGKAFLRLAKSYAALPKLVVASGVQALAAEEPLGKVEEEVRERAVHLPPRPDEMNDEAELQELEQQLRRMELESGRPTPPRSAVSSSASSQHSSRSSSRSDSGTNTPVSESVARNIQAWHANLEARLRPFWSSTLPNRTVRVSVYASHGQDILTSPPFDDSSDDEDDAHRRPIVTREVITSADGSFQVKFALPWEKICVHPAALHIAFGDAISEPNIFVIAELLPPPSRPPTPTSVQPMPHYFTPIPRRIIPTALTDLCIPLTHTPIRVISDIDDTVKLSGILQGARAVFHNVFVKDLSENVIPGMGDWYTSMWSRGVRFHYVSNGPFELLPVVSNFFQLSNLPPGSVKLKSYAGRSLFNGIFSAPAERKRAGVVDILNNFPECQFILIGDSGEQDLELYASLAKSRPEQILAIFIRDARVASGNGNGNGNGEGGGQRPVPLDDPTGERVMLNGGFGLGFGEDSVNVGSGGTITLPKPAAVSSAPSATTLNGEQRSQAQTHRGRRGITRSLSEFGSGQTLGRGSRATSGHGYVREDVPQRTHSYADVKTVFGGGGMKRDAYGNENAYGYYVATQPKGREEMIILDAPLSEEPVPMATPTPSTYEGGKTPTSSSSGSGSSQSQLQAQVRPQAQSQVQGQTTRPIPHSQRTASSIPSMSIGGYFSSKSSLSLSTSSRSSTMSRTGLGQASLTDAERKRLDLQVRLYKARMEVPREIPVRVFVSPEECVEAEAILEKVREGARRV